MNVKLKPLEQQVIVITGASSGIGLATALAATEAGAKVVLAARSSETLDLIVDNIAEAGGTAVAVPATTAVRAAIPTRPGRPLRPTPLRIMACS